MLIVSVEETFMLTL